MAKPGGRLTLWPATAAGFRPAFAIWASGTTSGDATGVGLAGLRDAAADAEGEPPALAAALAEALAADAVGLAGAGAVGALADGLWLGGGGAGVVVGALVPQAESQRLTASSEPNGEYARRTYIA